MKAALQRAVPEKTPAVRPVPKIHEAPGHTVPKTKRKTTVFLKTTHLGAPSIKSRTETTADGLDPTVNHLKEIGNRVQQAVNHHMTENHNLQATTDQPKENRDLQEMTDQPKGNRALKEVTGQPKGDLDLKEATGQPKGSRDLKATTRGQKGHQKADPLTGKEDPGFLALAVHPKGLATTVMAAPKEVLQRGKMIDQNDEWEVPENPPAAILPKGNSRQKVDFVQTQVEKDPIPEKRADRPTGQVLSNAGIRMVQKGEAQGSSIQVKGLIANRITGEILAENQVPFAGKQVEPPDLQGHPENPTMTPLGSINTLPTQEYVRAARPMN